jgi:hypothetical protein
MKRVLAILFLIVVVAGAYWLFFKTDNNVKKGQATQDEENVIVSKKHSQEFNDRVNAAVVSYLLVKDAFVNGDSVAAKREATKFNEAIKEIPLSELQNDQSQIMSAAQQQVSDIQANAAPIENGQNLAEMRRDFFMVSENLYPFLKTIGYEGEKLFWQNCPMAFGDNEEANWLSNTRQINNPYLGKNHPVYKSAMLHCGEVKDSIYAK